MFGAAAELSHNSISRPSGMQRAGHEHACGKAWHDDFVSGCNTLERQGAGTRIAALRAQEAVVALIYCQRNYSAL